MAAFSEQVKDQGSYQTHRVQLLRQITSRTDNTSLKDEDFLNCVIESIKSKSLDDNRQFVMKRAGVGVQIPSVGISEVRGMHYWDDWDRLLYVVDNDIFVYDFNTGINTALNDYFTTTSGEVGFVEYLYDNNAVVIAISDGIKLLTVDGNNVVSVCTDPDLPSPHIPAPVFIDGYLFLAKVGTADVYNSDLNNPLSWTAGNFISAEMRGDLVVRITTVNNYLIVFGSNSIEYFWDAGNASGSPMQRNDTPVKFNAYLGGFSQLGNVVYFVGENENGQPEVYRLKDFKIEELSSYTVSRYLNTLTDNVNNWKAAVLAVQGHAFYLLSAGSYTYVCDVETGVWVRWAYQANTNFPIACSSRATTNTSRRSCFALKGNSATIYYLDDKLYQDSGVNFTFRVVTEALDFNTMNRKTMGRFSLVGDRPSADSYFSLSWSDDDYQSYSSVRTINMNQDLPSTYRLGSFRQRSFKIEYADNYPFRIQKYEVDINKGIS